MLAVLRGAIALRQPLAPALPALAAGALGQTAMDGHEADRLFGQVVCRIDRRLGDEAEVTVVMIDEPIGQVGRLTGVGQLNDRIADQGVADRGQRFAKASLRGKLFAAMDHAEQLPQVRQQQLSVAAVGSPRMLDQKLHIPDQMGQAELDRHVFVQPHVFAII